MYDMRWLISRHTPGQVAKKKSATQIFPFIADESNGCPLRSVRTNFGSSNFFGRGSAGFVQETVVNNATTMVKMRIILS